MDITSSLVMDTDELSNEDSDDQSMVVNVPEVENPCKISKKRKIQNLSIQKKAAIINAIIQRKSTVNKSAKDYNLPHNTISTWLKNKEKILAGVQKGTVSTERKRQRCGQYEQVERALLMWFKDMRTNAPEATIDGPVLKIKAEEFAQQLDYQNFQCSNGFIDRFKARHGITFRTVCGESSSVKAASTKEWFETVLPQLLQSYSPSDIFNADEFALFWRALPLKTYAFKGDKCSGGKHAKDRISVLIGANMDGSEKLPLLVIGKSKTQRCFKHTKTLPVRYEANKKSWMTKEIFTRYLIVIFMVNLSNSQNFQNN